MRAMEGTSCFAGAALIAMFGCDAVTPVGGLEMGAGLLMVGGLTGLAASATTAERNFVATAALSGAASVATGAAGSGVIFLFSTGAGEGVGVATAGDTPSNVHCTFSLVSTTASFG